MRRAEVAWLVCVDQNRAVAAANLRGVYLGESLTDFVRSLGTDSFFSATT